MTHPSIPLDTPSRLTPETHQRGESKLARIPIKVVAQKAARLPPWIRAKFPGSAEVMRIKRLLREQRLTSVCEEAACPNLGECFGQGIATFMIMGDLCTRRCPFCDVAHGHPQPVDPAEPTQLAEVVRTLGLRYVVITSVNRDDLRDGGAAHFAACVREIRAQNPEIRVETLVPDFRGRQEIALASLAIAPPDIFNHNLETVPRLYRQVRPGADYGESLQLLRQFTQICPDIPTKSGLMLGLGETTEEVLAVLRDLRAHHCTMLTMGQYLQPSQDHLPVERFITPEEFNVLRIEAEALGFSRVASAPLVRSSYHADMQAGPLLLNM
jgi:lipoyl synthase